MSTSGTIYPDGRVQYHGYEPMKSRLLGITRRTITIHHSAGRYWDNSGEHYGAAHVEVYELAQLRQHNEEGAWFFELGGRLDTFHPTPKIACEEAVSKLAYHGAEIAQAVNEETKTE